MTIKDQFGFLPEQLDLECSGFKVYCVDNFQEKLEFIRKIVKRDGFIYPHNTYSAVVNPINCISYLMRKVKQISNSEINK